MNEIVQKKSVTHNFDIKISQQKLQNLNCFYFFRTIYNK